MLVDHVNGLMFDPNIKMKCPRYIHTLTIVVIIIIQGCFDKTSETLILQW